MKATIRKFGYPAARVCEWEHWIALLRPSQPTIGSLVLAAKEDATSFAALPRDAFAELADVVPAGERLIDAAIAPAKLNYLMLMMADPHVLAGRTASLALSWRLGGSAKPRAPARCGFGN